jgi:hypothetical protein
MTVDQVKNGERLTHSRSPVAFCPNNPPQHHGLQRARSCATIAPNSAHHSLGIWFAIFGFDEGKAEG